jgi:hypothetical protein
MLKIHKIVTPSPDQWEIVIEGMRNPMNAWDKIDSGVKAWEKEDGYDIEYFDVGDNDMTLMQRLTAAGTDHRKFMRMLPVHITLTAPLYWWKEYDTYKVGTVSNSCSTMHKIHAKEFTLDDFSHEHLFGFSGDEYRLDSMDVLCEVIKILNLYRERFLECTVSKYGTAAECASAKKQYWWQMIQLLPSSYNQKRTCHLNYENLINIYHARRNHKLTEWHEYCAWIESLPYAAELICGGAE